LDWNQKEKEKNGDARYSKQVDDGSKDLSRRPRKSNSTRYKSRRKVESFYFLGYLEELIIKNSGD
jgi:hypothetical protein